MPKINSQEKRGRGRPKSFDRDQAIDVAMKMFWDRGFEGTNLEDLIHTMGISCSSFYNTFESKEKLYHEATEAYLACAGEWFLGELNAADKDARTAIEDTLKSAAKQYTGSEGPCGCMIAIGETHVAPQLHSVRELVASHRKSAISIFAERIRRGIKEGDLPSSTKVDALASYYSAVSQGMAVQARDGATREQLQEIIDVAMQAWPVRATAPA